ncbi:hypothetical protein HCU01_28140 [Halomonas cupida]|uniref:Putative acetyltransferase n=2 Tax=Halomonas cupida TaxID=44933 RepID=A0A1M7H630_9GAMM|nr:hypothetical protein HCU01_28140 [Halomonas cupida]SHM23796.1 putative acetyltransferase [Halomonas cupida]
MTERLASQQQPGRLGRRRPSVDSLEPLRENVMPHLTQGPLLSPLSSPSSRLVYREARARDAADQAEVFHHAVMQGASQHYSLGQRQAWAECLPREASAWLVRQALYTTLVAECDGHCVGFLELDITRAHIATLYVWPSLVGKGIGMQLLEQAEGVLQEAGARRVIIEASLCLVESLMRRGWESHGEERVERAGEWLSRYSMSKCL